MAKYKGIVTLNGTIGGMNFYDRLGKPTARKSGGGFNGKDIKTKASMIRVRENGSEFGRVSKIKSLLRRAMTPFFGTMKDGTLHGRMMTMMQQVKAQDLTSGRGQRTFWKGLQTADGQRLLKDFLFTPAQAIALVFDGLPKVLNAGAVCDFSGLTLNSSSFKGVATAVDIQYFVVDFNEEGLGYEMKMSTKLFIEKSDIPEVLPSLSIENLSENPMYRMVFVHVQFQQKVNQQFYHLNEQGMLGIRCLEVV